MAPPSIPLYAQRNLGISGQTKAGPVFWGPGDCLPFQPVSCFTLSPFLQLLLPLNFSTGCSCGSRCCTCLRSHLLSLTISGKDDAISHARMRMQPPLNTASGLRLLYRSSLGFVGMIRGSAGRSWDPSVIWFRCRRLKVCWGFVKQAPGLGNGLGFQSGPLVQLPSRVQMKQVLGISSSLATNSIELKKVIIYCFHGEN